jgi:phosphoribosylglycinamide formyltransferase 1
VCLGAAAALRLGVAPLYNLAVELDRSFETTVIDGIDVALEDHPDERMLAWIDDIFGGSWSSEAFTGANVVARCNGEPVGFATFDAAGLTFAWLQGVAREPGVGLFGPVGVVPDKRNRGLGTVLLRRALDALRRRGYRRALIPAVGEMLLRFYAEAAGARVVESFEPESLYRRGRRVLILASGYGSNFQAVADAVAARTLPIDIVALFSNNLHAYALVRARNAGIPAHLIAWERRDEARARYDERLLEAARAEEPDLVLLLGWMHLLPDRFVRAFPQMLNLHPAFLPLDATRDDVVMPDGTRIPAFRGARAVRDAVRASSPWVGATLHRVTEATDRGPVLTRKPVRVKNGEKEEQLLRRVHGFERGVVRSGLMRWLYEG